MPYKGAKDGNHYWLTPPDLMEKLQNEFHFDFDACPHPRPDDFDGLVDDWEGTSVYVNPPFGFIMHQGPDDKKPRKKGPTFWARKAIEEYKKGKTVVMVYPMDKWVLMMLEYVTEVRNLGDVKWVAIEDDTAHQGTGRHIAMFVLRGTPHDDKRGKDDNQRTSKKTDGNEKDQNG